MKLLIDIGHPAHVHVFKNAIRELRKKGHEITIVTEDTVVANGILE
jgi:predicted glycosyltransferase